MVPIEVTFGPGGRAQWASPDSEGHLLTSRLDGSPGVISRATGGEGRRDVNKNVPNLNICHCLSWYLKLKFGGLATQPLTLISGLRRSGAA